MTKSNNKITAKYSQPDFESMTDEDFYEYLRQISTRAMRSVSSPETDTPKSDKEETEPFKTFSSEEEYNSDRQKYADELYAPMRTDNETFNKIKELADRYYEGNGIEKLVADLESLIAEEEGINPDEYREKQELIRDAQSWRSQQSQQKEDDDKRNEIINRWKAEAERLKAKVPDFDFVKAMENPEFRKLIIDGGSISEAYYSLRLADLDNGSAKGRQPLNQNAASKNAYAGGGVNDLMSLNDKDFMKEIRKIIGK